MKNLPQWINWRLEERPGEKPAKVPCDTVTDQRIDPHDPAHWLTYATACERDAAHTGFVLTDNDPYYCVDLDHAWDGHTWSPLALAVCGMFPGAYMEVSYSQDGLHVIGQGRPPAGYGTRNQALGIECYHTKRFIAITGTGAQGDPNTRHDLTTFAALYLKPASDGGAPAEWTTAPCAGSNPIQDDDELIRKMLAARASAGVAFGGKASFADLWTGNAAALGDAWPSQTDAYDRSAADAAAAAHLAFWTGKDCARIERLMRRSALVREKWDRRGDDYLKRTIVGAVGRVTRVYDVGTPEAATAGRAGWQYLTAEAQHEHFAGCVYVADLHRVFVPNGTFLKPEAFNALYGGFEFEVAQGGGRPEKKAFTAFTENRATKFPKAETTCFRPDKQPCEIVTLGRTTAVNTYVPALVDIAEGDATPFLDLMARLFPDETDRAIMLAYLAALRQYPGVKFRWCPLLQGVEGNLKGAITKIAEYCVSEQYTHRVNAKELGDSGAKFTGWLERKLLVVIEEIYVSDRRELLDTIKPLITDDRVEIQRKGVDQKTGENRANFILTSNHKDAIQKTRNDRRYAIFYTGQQSVDDLARDGMAGDYGPRLYAWLRQGGYAATAGYLTRYAIPDALNPATLCHRAPTTSSTEAAIAESRGVVEQCILEACEEGRQGFAGGWISSAALSGLLSEIKRTVSPRKRGDLLKSIGYVKHPALGVSGQVSAPLFNEGMKRPYLYVREGSINYINLQDEQSVINAYVKAQGYAIAQLHKL